MLMVTADLTKMAMLARSKEGGFNAGHFIDSIQHHLGPDGTLIIPSFNFNLQNNDSYHPDKSIPITGALAVTALKRPDFIRTGNPLHSFLVWGKQAEALSALNNQSSFSADSPFSFMKDNRAMMLLVDTTISAAFTFVHYVEEMEMVRYRKFRKIGILLGGNEERLVRKDYLLYAKKPGWTMDLAGLEQLLTEKQIAKKISINQVSCTLVDLEAAYPVIKEDILQNKAKNLARFSFELYLREKAKSMLAAVGIHTLADKISHDPGLL
jgi:aminoglycoside 3-N-acetyltransferase